MKFMNPLGLPADHHFLNLSSQAYRRSTGLDWIQTKSGQWKLHPVDMRGFRTHLNDKRKKEFWSDDDWVASFDLKLSLAEAAEINAAISPCQATPSGKGGWL